MIRLFLDTEFTDFKNMDMISIGLVSEDGNHEFYRENSSHEPNFRSDFVNQVVMPLLEGSNDVRKTEKWIALDLKHWLDNLPTDEITIVCDYAGDWHLMKALLMMYEDRRVQINAVMLNAAFQDMLTERGIHNTPLVRLQATMTMCHEQEQYFKQDPRQHHALVDAKANRHGWIAGYEWAKAQ